MPTKVNFVLLSSLVLLAIGCASTTVTRHPAPNDCGVRFYRPKPYLLVTPDGGNSPQAVQIKLEYLPDFSEEYSINIRSGLGANKTKVTLDQGWNLTKIDYDVDSKVPENIEAVAELIDKVGGILPTAKADNERTTVKANNVPLGYYEAVLGSGPCGGKQLFGWRYIGFLPYAQCPTDMSGYACGDCQSESLFALVFENGTMTFKSLADASTAELTAAPATAAEPTAVDLDSFQLQLTKALKLQLKTELAPDDVSLDWSSDQLTVTIHLTETQWALLQERYQVDSGPVEGSPNGQSQNDQNSRTLRNESLQTISATVEKYWSNSQRPARWDVQFVRSR